jgi:signal transduction histidine kinase
MDVRTIAYRIAQEAISNAVDFADASHLDVTLEDEDAGVLVRVADDGCGFSVDELSNANRLGFTSMRERAELAGGWFRLHSKPGAGTTVEFWLPGRIEQADP